MTEPSRAEREPFIHARLPGTPGPALLGVSPLEPTDEYTHYYIFTLTAHQFVLHIIHRVNTLVSAPIRFRFGCGCACRD